MWHCSSVKPADVEYVVRCSQVAADLPISSASSRTPHSSGLSPSSSSLPAGSSSRSGSPVASRGWRTSQIRSPSWATIATAPGWTTHWRVTSPPSSWRNRPSQTWMNLPSKTVRASKRSKRELIARACWQARSDRRGLVEQREADVEHALERDDAHALGRLVVVLGPVGEVDALDALDGERVRVRAAAGHDPGRLVAARTQRCLRRGDRGGRALRAVAVEQLLADDVDVALRGAGAVVDGVDHPRDDILRAVGVERARLRQQPAALRHDVGRAAAAVDGADVGGRLLVDAVTISPIGVAWSNT